jgi:hypothetical protein
MELYEKINRFIKVQYYFVVATFFSQTAHAETCVKRVFNQFCLGGAANTLMSAEPTTTKQEDDGTTLYEFSVSGKHVNVLAKDDTIIAVERYEPPGNWLNFTDWKVKLVRLYGRATDQSTFPAYATSRSSRLNALKAGKGVAKASWSEPGWSVTLVWKEPEFIRLKYTLKTTPSIPANSTEGL